MEVTKKDIEKLIELRKEDTYLNHLITVFTQGLQPTGEIGQNEIKAWKKNMWNSAFYPIFTFELNASNHLINISEKLNPVGKTLIGILLIGIIFFISNNYPTEFNFLESWFPFLIVIAFLLFFIFIFRKIYKFEKQNQLDEIYKILDIEVEDKQLEKEWSLKNILIRLFTYPFCLFLIGLNFFLIIPNEQYFLALGSFGFVGFYLVSDLKMIFRKK